MTEKKFIDWTVIEVDFRAGIKPLRQMADEHDVSHVAISKRAKKDGWTRDLAGRIKQKAEEKVNKAAVNTEVNTQKVLTEQTVVEANAELQYRIRIEHRTDIGRSRKLFGSLLLELELETASPGLFASLGELMDESGPDATGTWRKDRLNELYQKVISQTGRIDGAKKLTEMLEKLIKMERQAFGIDDTDQGSSTVDDLLKSLGQKIANDLQVS